MTRRLTPIERSWERHARDWEGVPTATRNAFGRWWHMAFRPGSPEPWFPPFNVAASMPDETLRCIRFIGTKGVRAIRERARLRMGAT
jgi:hypothetical protein